MRLIDADAILKADENSDKALVLGNGKSLEIAYALLKKKVEDAPTVDAVPVVHGRWICEWDIDLGITTVICSRCKDAREVRGCYVSTGGEGMYDEDAYCPNCGAKMDGGADHDA